MKLGEIVLYKITAADVAELAGNQREAGEVVPAIVTRVWPGEFELEASHNITVFGDGPKTAWRTSVRAGTEPGQIQSM